MSTTEIAMNTKTAPAKKTIKKIIFRRQAIKRFYENYDLTYHDFATTIRKDGWKGKEIKEESLIKKLWDTLVEEGGRCWNDSAVVIDVDADTDYDAEEDEEWEDYDAEENVWMYIQDEVSYDHCFPESAEKTPEQKEEEAKKKEEEAEKRAAESKKQAEEYAKKMDAHWTVCSVESIKTAIVKAEQFFKPKATGPLPPLLSREAMERMRNSRRCEILADMSKLVAELEDVAKW